jgi:hypothetical protein
MRRAYGHAQWSGNPNLCTLSYLHNPATNTPLCGAGRYRWGGAP